MRLLRAALDTPLDSPFSATLSVHGSYFTVVARTKLTLHGSFEIIAARPLEKWG